jgi:hypothetical protein
MSDPKTTPQGEFKIKHAGQIVASGRGPFPSIVDEAWHYFHHFKNEGPIEMSIKVKT